MQVLEKAERIRSDAELLAGRIHQEIRNVDPEAQNGLLEWLCVDYDPGVSLISNILPPVICAFAAHEGSENQRREI